ncbi:hypothetical protein [Streptomyces scopuliridis]|uniref:hypothetical protein n=1 Tax=Streptomyces scopuliridis TaxID=452529 RepID=UPI0036C9676D
MVCTCLRTCGRDGLALRDNRCHPYRLLDQVRPTSRRATQLVITLPTGKGGPFEAFPIGDGQALDYDEQRPALHTSRGQEPLFTIRRDWTPVLARLQSTPPGEPPAAAASLSPSLFDEGISGRRALRRTGSSTAVLTGSG